MSALRYHFRYLAAFHRDVTHATLKATADLSDADFGADAGLYFRSIHGTLSHLLGAEQIWHARLTQSEQPSDIGALYGLEPPAIGAAWESRSQDRRNLSKSLLEQADAWVKFVDSHPDDAALLRKVSYSTTDGTAASVVLAAGLAQVFNHGTHHRGQITAAFTRLGHPFPCQDMQRMGNDFLTYCMTPSPATEEHA